MPVQQWDEVTNQCLSIIVAEWKFLPWFDIKEEPEQIVLVVEFSDENAIWTTHGSSLEMLSMLSDWYCSSSHEKEIVRVLNDELWKLNLN